MAILGLIESYCMCPIDNTKFHNTSLSCSRGKVSFNSILAHASDDGSVTALVLLDTFEAGLSKTDNPTITIDGQELTLYMPLDEDIISSGAISPLIAGLIAASTFFALTCIIITW